MNQEQFNSLPSETQEEFINAGGVISAEQGSVQVKESSGDSGLITPTKPAVEQTGTESVSCSGTDCAKESTDGISFPSAVDSPSASIYSDGFDIKDPLELLFLLDDNISSGRVSLHDWQAQFMLDFAKPSASDRDPFQAVMRACNGSGKDKYIIAPCVVWLCMRYKKARGVVTSSSGVQLDNQTCAYITDLCNSANRKWGKMAGNSCDVWKVNYRKYECIPTESPIICYATDEPGKAEGFHPLEFGAKMVIAVSEDKSVPDDINVALNKCTGYTHRMHVSTPGNAFGHFFEMCSTAVNRRDVVDLKEVKPEDYIHYHIPASMCSHLADSYIKQMKRDLPGGENGGAYKSQVEAEFAITDEMVVIPYTYIWRAKKKTVEDWIQESYNKAGLDLSDGGDETVLIVRNGNRVLAVIPFRFDNTEDTVEFLQGKFRDHKLVHPEALIFADCGGIGKPILDRLKRLGWKNIRYCDNRARSIRPKTYKNWGAESWFHFGDLLKQNEIILPDDNVLTRQLSTRYYKIIDGAVHQLLSKIEMRSRNFPSPDRADACVLAFSDYKSTFVENKDRDVQKPFEVEEVKKTEATGFTLKGWARGTDKKRGWKINGGQKDFSMIQEELRESNRRILTGN